jgi:hypothetical protein
MLRSGSRIALILVAALAVLGAVSGPALASHGGGGGGGTTSPPPPTAAPAVSLSPSTLTFGPQELGTTSAPQTVTLTNTGTASLFINSTNWNGLDFLVPSDTNLCIGTSVAPGASCTIGAAFSPGTTGTRTAAISVVDNAPSSPQVISLTGTGTSVNGPTPMTVDTTGESCDATACDLGSPGSTYVNNFLYRGLSASGDATAPYTWTVAAGTLPPGVTMVADGEIYGTPTATGSYVFTAKVTDANGQTATQPFRLTISPPPPALTSAQQSCQHAPSSVTAPLAGPSIGGVTPSGQGLGDQSQLTACGGYTKITAQVKNVNLPDGTVLWVALSGGGTIGRITLTNHSATMPAFVTTASLRQQSMLVYRNPPLGGATAQTPILSGKFG